tara:strand:+ start:742 stop:1116 length:375 start_codon:yes stop_codon:yes gene_type:complete
MNAEQIMLGGVNSIEGKVSTLPTHDAINEKIRTSVAVEKGGIEGEIKPVSAEDTSDTGKESDTGDEVIIITGEDAARYLLPMRDDFEPALTFRAMVLATILCGFQAVMYQIYSVSNVFLSCLLV